MKLVSSGAVLTAARDAMLAALRTYERDLSPEEMLALTCQLVGQLIAMQDQRLITSANALQIIIANIKIGNAAAIEGHASETAGRA